MAVLAVAGLLVGCDAGPATPDPAPERLGWREVTLPGEGVLVRDAAFCAGSWFVVGAVRDGRGGTRPAAWSGAGDALVPLEVDARSYYGRQNVLYTAACRGDRLVAVGAKPGGAHGNPRTSSWLADGSGPLREVSAPFDLYGGPSAVNVSRLASGPAGFLIAGNRSAGAAVWSSADGGRFAIHEGVPGLRSDPAGVTWAFDVVADGPGWLLAGGVLPAGRTDRDVLGWRSVDGRSWSRVPAADPGAAYEELHRVTVRDGVPIGVGLSGSSFGVWRLEGGRWVAVGTFGSVPAFAKASVESLTVSGGVLRVVTLSPDGYAAWASADGAAWRPVSLPSAVPAGAGTAVVAVGAGSELALITDDASAGRFYRAETIP